MRWFDFPGTAMCRFILAALFGFSATGRLFAHPGHGTTTPDSPAHYVFEPVHALPVVAIVVAIAGAVLFLRRRQGR